MRNGELLMNHNLKYTAMGVIRHGLGRDHCICSDLMLKMHKTPLNRFQHDSMVIKSDPTLFSPSMAAFKDTLPSHLGPNHTKGKTKAKTIKEQAEKIREKSENIKRNFRFVSIDLKSTPYKGHEPEASLSGGASPGWAEWGV